MARRIARIFLVVFLLVGLLAAGALLFVTSKPGSKWISKELHDGIQRQTGLQVEFRQIDLEFFPPRLLLEDLKVKGKDLDIGCTVEEAEVSPSALDLLAGKISIEEIYMGAPNCHVFLSADDMARFRSASKIGDTASDRIDLSFLPKFDVVALSSGRFEFEIDDPTEMGRLNLTVNGLYLDITGRHRGQEQIEIRGLLEKANVNFQKETITLDEQVRGLKLRAALDEDALNIRTFQGKLAEVAVECRDVYVPVNIAENQLNAMFVSVNVPLRRLARFPIETPALKGTAGFAGQLNVAVQKSGKPEVIARGDVTLRGVEVDDFVIGDLDGTISYNSRGVAWSDVELRTAGGALRMSGEMAFDKKMSIQSTVTLDDIELAKLLENLTVDNSYVMQQVSGKAKVTGTLNGLSLKGNATLRVKNHQVFDDGFRQPGKSILLSIPDATVQGPFTVTENSFEGKGFLVRRNKSLVNVDMGFAFNKQAGWNLHAWSSRMDLGDVGQITGFAVDGNGRLDCKIKAPGYGAPTIDGSIDFTDMNFSGFDYRHASSVIRFDGEKLMFDNLDLRSRKSHYHAGRLTLDFHSPFGLSINTIFDIERAELEDLGRSYHLDTSRWGNPKGYVSGTVDIRYQSKPENLRVDTVVSHEGLTLFNEVFGKGAVNAVYDNDILTVNRFDMSKGKGSVAISGTLGGNDELNFMGVATNVRIEDIVFPAVSDLEIEGTGQALVVIEGTWDNPRGKATVRISDMKRHEMRFGNSDVELTLDDNVVGAAGTLANGMAVLEHSVFDFNKNKFELEAFVTDLDLAAVLGFQSSKNRLALKTTGELAVIGKLAGNPRIRGNGRIFNLSGRYNRLAIANKQPFNLSFEDSILTFDGARFLGKNFVFDMDARIDARKFKLTAHGLTNLKLLNQLTDTITESAGTLSFNTVISGPWDDPKFRGEAEVRDAQFSVEGFPHVIESVNGKLQLGSSMIRLEDFSAKTAGGSMDMHGWLSLHGMRIDDYRFTLTAANLGLRLMDDLSLKASTRNDGLIMIPGKERDIPQITGDVEISNFKYTAPVHIIELSDLDMTGIGGKRKRTKRPRLFDKSKDSFEYDIRLHGERNLEILNNLLDARLKIDDHEEPLRLIGTSQNFGFTGRVLGADGEVRFAGKTFEIQNAFLSFKDPNRPENPYFRVTADVDVRDWKVTITAEGTVEEYEVRLSSQPYLSQEDIVILLLTGMIKQEHTAMNSQGLAMSLLPLLENAGSDAIPVEVNVYSEYSEKAAAETTRVALGKRIADDIWVQVSSSVGQEQDVEGTLSYEINDNVSVSAGYDNKTETSKAGNWGLDLRFRLEF
ncbi:MAG: translocation/assembly module TamB domain-containing protein [Deltaproteobacteria bacterium]|nr:translocation/assembly module TamB domain-containing protein [Deltaproteobacteria bacterium]